MEWFSHQVRTSTGCLCSDGSECQSFPIVMAHLQPSDSLALSAWAPVPPRLSPTPGWVTFHAEASRTHKDETSSEIVVRVPEARPLTGEVPGYFAVGTPVTGRPPHRSPHELLIHGAPALGPTMRRCAG